MKRFIELKHVGPKAVVRQLIDELLDHLEHKVRHFPSDAVSTHVLFEENGSRTLSRASVTCHVPGRMVAAHEERREPGQAIRRAFKEVERQLEKQDPVRRRHLRKRAVRAQRDSWLIALALAASPLSAAAEEPGLSPEAQALLPRLEARDGYDRQKAFLQLEALREPAAGPVVRRYLTHRDEETRAFSIRALAAIEGPAAIPTLLERLKRDREPLVRTAAILALEPLHVHDPAVLTAFIAALRDRKSEVRLVAVDAVSRIDEPRARQALRVRWKRERNRDVRRVLEQVMKRLGEPT